MLAWTAYIIAHESEKKDYIWYESIRHRQRCYFNTRSFKRFILVVEKQIE
jgi:hypothetical protein